MATENTRAENLVRRHLANPFLVLGLPAGAGGGEVERRGQMLLSMLEAGLAEAGRYPTPLGEQERTGEMVREAMAELRDPDRRLLHEWWMRSFTG